jgi:hypothetical protein
MRYEFVVAGSVNQDLAETLPELSVAPYPTGGSSLFGPVRDEADLARLLATLRQLGLSVVDVHRLPD